jgi:tripartite-type tricarboxylate transporter receptor subunit TctC
MKVKMIRKIGLSLVALLLIAAAAQAQTPWPTKPVKILVPTAPGGTADALARQYALHLGKVLGQQFYVENRGGAGNVLGIDAVVRSPADGYTLLLGAGTITINHLVTKKLPYDVLRDLTPVTQMISVPNVLVVNASQPMKSLADYVAAAKAAPGRLNYGSAGVGSNLHLAMELLKYRTGIEVTHVPYKGVGPALQDTLAGHVMSMISNIPSSKPHIDKGSLRALAVTSLKRSPALPDVPTMSDEGVTGYEVLNWFGVFAPAGTPKEIVDRLAAEAAAMFTDPKTRESLTGEGADPIASSPADFTAFVRAEIKKWDEVGKAANIQPTE